MNDRMLVAGVGNIFLGDDGFGSEVARRLATAVLPDDVTLTDFGIGGIHLAYELLEGYRTAILVDACPRGEEPGTVFVMEVDRDETRDGPTDQPVAIASALADAHAMEPGSVLEMVGALGVATRVLVVGCEPADLDDGIGLSPPVRGAVDEAVRVVLALVEGGLASADPISSASGSADGPRTRRES